MNDDTSPHRVKAFCIGQAKAGTASLWGLLATHHRAAHEPERAETLRLVLDASRGVLTQDALHAQLAARDVRLDLEYDIAWANQFLAHALSVRFSEARFVVLVRDPYTWLQSIMGHLVSRELPPDVRAFVEWWFQPALHPHSRYEGQLAAMGLYSVSAYLSAWCRHVDVSMNLFPPSRRLVIRTHHLQRAHGAIAEFLRVPIASLDRRRGRLNRGSGALRLASLVDAAYLRETITARCGAHLARLFPELEDPCDPAPLWRGAGGEEDEVS